ncbi:MAG: hypothetical protein ACFFAK_10800 [Promethearchaeota archaeon]
MIVKILKVSRGTPSGSKIMDFWVDGQLKNGEIIEIFDLDPFDLRGYEGKYLDCLILANVGVFDKDDIIFLIRGKYIKSYELPLKWKGVHDPIDNWSAVKTENGIFLLDPGIIDFKDKDGQIIEFDGIRLDLIAFLPLD